MGYEAYATWDDPIGRAMGTDREVNAPIPSKADYEAVRMLMGGKALTEMVIAGSKGNGYTVERRPDTKNGGTYLFCPCSGWAFGIGKGRPCTHARQAEDAGL